MSLLAQLKKDSLLARKAADGVRATLLSTLIGEAEMVGKNAGNRESSDDEVLHTIRKFLKNNQEALAVIKDEARLAVLRTESDILNSYLPAMASEADVKAFIDQTVAGLADRSPRSMGTVMAALKARYGTNFDARQANVWVKAALTG
ncbi:GatB/YqeY domain-containing protein [Azoarcus sp. L1K30]|uniref:GatB/YqeY domain-containing protein n=1 Tax=Azoarcus sp. L1K30 TaxID=2820277 RepID=UPI001B83CAE4|nr:GatB/YqeY domain-containing protein [Azoarcus sp. L1K30]MBR0566066.1 GatB/YqeY domain-containing protein [Azoarcus sp. L1K30]